MVIWGTELAATGVSSRSRSRASSPGSRSTAPSLGSFPGELVLPWSPQAFLVSTFSLELAFHLGPTQWRRVWRLGMEHGERNYIPLGCNARQTKSQAREARGAKAEGSKFRLLQNLCWKSLLNEQSMLK